MSQPSADIWHMPRMVVFLAVAEHGSFSAAARALGLSKGVVSTHIKQLEAVCDARLFERSTRQVALTQAGRALRPHATALSRAWRAGLEAVEREASEPTGTLVLTAPTLLEQLFALSRVVARYVALYPAVQVELRLDDVVLDVIDRGIDVALRTGPLPDSELQARRLARDHEIVVAAPRLLAGVVPHQPSALAQLGWVRHARIPPRVTLWGPDGAEFSLDLNTRVRVNQATGLHSALVAGAGIGLIPSLAVREELASGRLVRLVPDWRARQTDVYAVFPSRAHLAPKVARFIELLTDQVDGYA